MYKYQHTEDDGLYESITDGVITITHEISRSGKNLGNFSITTSKRSEKNSCYKKQPISKQIWLLFKKAAKADLSLRKKEIDQQINLL